MNFANKIQLLLISKVLIFNIFNFIFKHKYFHSSAFFISFALIYKIRVVYHVFELMKRFDFR